MTVSGYGESVRVTLQGFSFFATISSAGFTTFGYGLLYTTPDCTGTPYLLSLLGSPPLGAYLEVLGYVFSGTLYVPGTPVQNLSVYSYLDPVQGCVSQSGYMATAFTVAAAIPLSDTGFVPPFSFKAPGP